MDGADHSADAAAAIAAAAAAAAAGAEVAASQAMAPLPDHGAGGDAVAEAQAAAQMAQLNAEAAQQAVLNAEAAQQVAQVSQQQMDMLAQAQAHALTLDPATLAAMQALPVSGGMPALQLDPNLAANLVAQGLQIPGFTLVDQNGAMQLMGAEGLQLAHGAEMYMTQQTGHEDYGETAGGAGSQSAAMGNQPVTRQLRFWCGSCDETLAGSWKVCILTAVRLC